MLQLGSEVVILFDQPAHEGEDIGLVKPVLDQPELPSPDLFDLAVSRGHDHQAFSPPGNAARMARPMRPVWAGG